MPLTLLLTLALHGPAFAERSLPVFPLDSVKLSGIPKLSDGYIPPVPPPTDTGYYSRSGAGGIRLDSSVTVVVDGEGGRAEINFPGQRTVAALAGYRSSLFIKFIAQSSAPVLTWAAVVCSGGKYLGYKGASLKLPDGDSGFSIKDDSLALGGMKTLLYRTHPWVVLAAGTDGFRNLDRLCSAGFPEKMKAYSVSSLPRAAGSFSFKYNPSGNKLTVTWHK